ncbi:MAG: SDR family oxidoreductase [Agitococcus sp.]
MTITAKRLHQQQHDYVLLQSTQRCQQEPYFSSEGALYFAPIKLLAHHSVTAKLYRMRKCYVCKQPFNQVHFFYHTMCPSCAQHNYQRRSQQCSLEGRIALVTGGRIKIGFEIGLKLLRAGATVHITTRFKYDAANRYAQQTDYQQWCHRLFIHELDLRQLASVEQFCCYLQHQLSHLDIVINNAAQTIKKPKSYFVAMAQQEQQYALNQQVPCLQGFKDMGWQQQQGLVAEQSLTTHFLKDEFNEPLDLSAKNSWHLRLHECSTEELIETQVVNVMAPFLLNARLKTLLQQSPKEQRFIVNVSAMEGQFNRENKTMRHPQTNMAKAALNMMTRTAAMDYVQDQIFMTSVDTGWVTQEHAFAVRQSSRLNGMVPPLDCVDGAARVLAPIFDALTGQQPLYGVFLKDYVVTDW